MSLKQRINQICSKIGDASFAVRYWDGDRVHYGSSPEEFVIHLVDEGALHGFLSNVKLRLGEAYMDGAIQVEGSLERFVRLAFLMDPRSMELTALERAALAALSLRQRNTPRQARKNVAHHYDLGNDFYRLWLDRGMTYSCAYFRDPRDDIDTAQQQKLRHLCGKLRLTPHHRLLDIGCGWGQLIVHAASEHGCSALGITLSEEQVAGARATIEERGLRDRVEVRLQDYRDVPEEGGFDRVVSVGMFEHVGQDYIDTYMRYTARLLRPGGAGVLHTMGRMREAPTSEWLRKYIFPGMYFPPLDAITRSMGEHGLYVVDVENLRLHYALTIDRWLAAFEANVEPIRAMFDERFVRMWRLYLHSSAASFRYSDLQLWQITFTRGLDNDWPLTRDYIDR